MGAAALAPLRGSAFVRASDPGLTPRAALRRPCGAEDERNSL